MTTGLCSEGIQTFYSKTQENGCFKMKGSLGFIYQWLKANIYCLNSGF